MDFRTNPASGGSDGCINFNDPVNKGLSECIQNFDVPKIYAKHCDIVSLADFIVVASEAVMARSHSSYDPNELFGKGSVAMTFRNQFSYGR